MNNLIRLIAGVISYFVAGALIMKFHYKASGTDIIPNKKLWFTFPLLLKVKFCVQHPQCRQYWWRILHCCFTTLSCFHCVTAGWMCVHIYPVFQLFTREVIRKEKIWWNSSINYRKLGLLALCMSFVCMTLFVLKVIYGIEVGNDRRSAKPGNGSLVCAAHSAYRRIVSSVLQGLVWSAVDMSSVSILILAAVCLHARFLPFCVALTTTEPSTPSPGSRPCPQVDGNSATCVCQHSGGTIDVTSLSNSDGTPR